MHTKEHQRVKYQNAGRYNDIASQDSDMFQVRMQGISIRKQTYFSLDKTSRLKKEPVSSDDEGR